MSREDLLREEVERISDPVYLTSKADIVEYYKDRYPGTGKTGWKQKLISDLLPFTPRTGKDPAKNLAKRFDPQRLDSPEKKNAGQYQAIGMTLPPVSRDPKSDTITVVVKGTQSRGRGKGTRDRVIEVTFTGADAYKFVNEPTYSDIWEAYDVEDGLFDDGDYEIEVSGVSAS